MRLEGSMEDTAEVAEEMMDEAVLGEAGGVRGFGVNCLRPSARSKSISDG